MAGYDDVGEIAKCMMSSDELLASAVLAKGMRDSAEIVSRAKMKKLFGDGNPLGNLFGADTND